MVTFSVLERAAVWITVLVPPKNPVNKTNKQYIGMSVPITAMTFRK